MNKRLFFLLCVVMILSNAFSQNPYRVDKCVSISSRDGVEKLERRQGMNGVKVASDMNTSAFKTVSESEERLDSIVMYSTDGFPFQKICYDYDIYGNITKENVFVYYNNIWCYCGFSLWEYDSRGNLLLEEYVGRAFIGLSPEGDFYGTEKSSYAYDENDSLISFQYYQV